MTLLIAAAAGADWRLTRRAEATPAEAVTFHRTVREALATIPTTIPTPDGTVWVGRDEPTADVATALLRPNAILNRRYRDAVGGREVVLLLVHTLDARDLVFHYPPHCYPGQGWTLVGESDVELGIRVSDAAGEGGLSTPGMRYDFVTSGFNFYQTRSVANCMLLPRQGRVGGVGRGMDPVKAAAAHPSRRHFGAAQVQVVIDGAMDESEWRRTVGEFVAACEPAIRAITAGASNLVPEEVSRGG